MLKCRLFVIFSVAVQRFRKLCSLVLQVIHSYIRQHKTILCRNLMRLPISRLKQEILGPYPVLHTHHTLICAGCVQWAGGCRGQGSARGQRRGQLLLHGSDGCGWTRFLFLLELLRRILRRIWIVRHLISRVSFTVNNWLEKIDILVCVPLQGCSLAQCRRGFCTPTSVIPNWNSRKQEILSCLSSWSWVTQCNQEPGEAIWRTVQVSKPRLLFLPDL